VNFKIILFFLLIFFYSNNPTFLANDQTNENIYCLKDSNFSCFYYNIQDNEDILKVTYVTLINENKLRVENLYLFNTEGNNIPLDIKTDKFPTISEINITNIDTVPENHFGLKINYIGDEYPKWVQLSLIELNNNYPTNIFYIGYTTTIDSSFKKNTNLIRIPVEIYTPKVKNKSRFIYHFAAISEDNEWVPIAIPFTLDDDTNETIRYIERINSKHPSIYCFYYDILSPNEKESIFESSNYEFSRKGSVRYSKFVNRINIYRDLGIKQNFEIIGNLNDKLPYILNYPYLYTGDPPEFDIEVYGKGILLPEPSKFNSYKDLLDNVIHNTNTEKSGYSFYSIGRIDYLSIASNDPKIEEFHISINSDIYYNSNILYKINNYDTILKWPILYDSVSIDPVQIQITFPDIYYIDTEKCNYEFNYEKGKNIIKINLNPDEIKEPIILSFFGCGT